MEYILYTDIFDEEIGEKFCKAVSSDLDSFIQGSNYKLTVSFHENSLSDIRFDKFHIPVPSKTNKGTREDKIYDVMSFQLNAVEQILSKKGIEISSTAIQGDNLEAENIVKIEVTEDDSKPFFTGKGKKKARIKVSCIMPSRPSVQKKASKMANEKISKMFYEFMDIIRDRKMMAEILEIEEKEDDDILYRAFAKQYGELWLATGERAKELRNKLVDKSIAILNKRIAEKEEKQNVTIDDPTESAK